MTSVQIPDSLAQNLTESDERQYHQHVTQMVLTRARHVHQNVIARHEETTAITRAMHELTITYTGQCTTFLETASHPPDRASNNNGEAVKP